MARDSQFFQPVGASEMPRVGGMPTFMRLPHVPDPALVGATFMFEILCVLADAVARRRDA